MTVSTGLGFKPYPCCRAAHASIDAVLYLRQKYALKAEHVSSITCKLNPLVFHRHPQKLNFYTKGIATCSRRPKAD